MTSYIKPTPSLLDGRVNDSLDNYQAFDGEVRRIEHDMDAILWQEMRGESDQTKPNSTMTRSGFTDSFTQDESDYDINLMYDHMSVPRRKEIPYKVSTCKNVRKRRVETTCITEPSKGCAAYEMEWSNRINLKSPTNPSDLPPPSPTLVNGTNDRDDDNELLDFPPKVPGNLPTPSDDYVTSILKLKFRLMDKYRASEISVRARGPGNRIIIEGRHEQPLGLVSEAGTDFGTEQVPTGNDDVMDKRSENSIFFREFRREFILPLAICAKDARARMVEQDLILEIPIPFHIKEKGSPVREIPIIFD